MQWRRFKRVGILPLVALLIGGAIACRINGSETARPTSTPTPGAVLVPTPTATPAVSPAPRATPTGTPTLRPSAFGRLRDLSSYRYTMHWEIGGIRSALTERLGRLAENPNALPDPFIVDVVGSFVSPNQLEMRYKISGVEDEFAVFIINRQQWLKLPGDTIVGPTPFQGSIDDVNEATTFWDRKVIGSAIPVSCAGPNELINGIPTRRCRISGATIQQMVSLLGVNVERGRVSSSSLELWLHDTLSYPVRVRIAVQGVDDKGKDFTIKGNMDVTDANSTDIQIRPPT